MTRLVPASDGGDPVPESHPLSSTKPKRLSPRERIARDAAALERRRDRLEAQQRLLLLQDTLRVRVVQLGNGLRSDQWREAAAEVEDLLAAVLKS